MCFQGSRLHLEVCGSGITYLAQSHLLFTGIHSRTGMWPTMVTEVWGGTRPSKSASRVPFFLPLWIIACRCEGWSCCSHLITTRKACLKIKMTERGTEWKGLLSAGSRMQTEPCLITCPPQHVCSDLNQEVSFSLNSFGLSFLLLWAEDISTDTTELNTVGWATYWGSLGTFIRLMSTVVPFPKFIWLWVLFFPSASPAQDLVWLPGFTKV